MALAASSHRMGHILSAQFGIPNFALWIMCGWIGTALLSFCGGYCSGLRSRKEAEQLKARIESLSIADEIRAEIPKQQTMVRLFVKSENELKTAIFRLSCLLSEGQRIRIENALSDYQALKIKKIMSIFRFPRDAKPKLEMRISRKWSKSATPCLSPCSTCVTKLARCIQPFDSLLALQLAPARVHHRPVEGAGFQIPFFLVID